VVRRILLLLASAVFLALPDGALAQRDDKTYCTQLADLYRRYVHTSSGWGSDAESAFAFDACRNGDPRAIAVLEKRLRENGIALPGREFRP
jgi:hypothetical protein